MIARDVTMAKLIRPAICIGAIDEFTAPLTITWMSIIKLRLYVPSTPS